MDLVEEIKNRLNIEDVISEYVQLKRSGSNWRGFSPFNNEKTPSFMVSPEKQIWHDFSSGKGGNMFSFVMEMEGVDFKGALDILARKAGLDPEKFKRSYPNNLDKERLYELLELATKFFQFKLKTNKRALDYVIKTRNFNKETILNWRFGFADINQDELKQFLLKKGYKLNEIKLAGLLNRYDNDLFRNRLIIPLQDERGRVIGFTARLLDSNSNLPKYLNTPQTILYDKSRHVFGLNFAKQSFRQNKYAVLVEGNLDVISSHQIGQTNVVATAGTALTINHLKTISRFVNDIRLCLDSDNAGIEATKRAILLASKINIDLNIVTIPQGKDPDELIKINPDLWIQIIKKKKYALDWLMNYFQTKYDIKTSSGKKNFSSQILPIIKNLQDEIEKDHYYNKLADLLEVSKESIILKSSNLQEIKNETKKTNKYQGNSSNQSQFLEKAYKIENNLLSIMIYRTTLRDLLNKLKSDYLLGTHSRVLFDLLNSQPTWDIKEIEKNIHQDKWQNLDDYIKILMLLYEEKYQMLNLDDLHYEATFLRFKLIENYVNYRKEQLSNNLQNIGVDERESNKIFKEIDKLNNLLNKFK